MTLSLKVFKLFVFLIVWQIFPYRGTNKRNCFYVHVSFTKRIFKFSRVIACVYPTTWSKFKNFIWVVTTSVIDKIAGYSIYALIHLFTDSQPIYQSKFLCRYVFCLTSGKRFCIYFALLVFSVRVRIIKIWLNNSIA